jgi:hypothetical protein
MGLNWPPIVIIAIMAELSNNSSNKLSQQPTQLQQQIEKTQRSTNAAEVSSSLKELIELLKSNRDLIRQFELSHYDQFLSHLFTIIAAKHPNLFTSSHFPEEIEFFFSENFCNSAIIYALIQLLRNNNINHTTNAIIADRINSFLVQKRLPLILTEVKLLFPPNSANLISSQAYRLSNISEGVLNEVCALPDLVANKFQRNIPHQIFLHNNYFPSIINEILYFYEESLNAKVPTDSNDAENCEENNRQQLITAGIIYLFNKLGRLNHSDVLIRCLLPLLSQYKQYYSEILMNVGVNSFELLISQLFTQLSARISPEPDKIQLIKRLFGPLFTEDSPIFRSTGQNRVISVQTNTILLKSLLSNKFFLLSPISLSAARLILGFLFEISYENSEKATILQPNRDYFDNCAVNLARTWGTEQFLRSSPHNLQYFVGEALLTALELLNSAQSRWFRANDIDLAALKQRESADSSENFLSPLCNHAILPFIMQGVQIRLNSPINPIRKSAILLAKALSTLISPLQPLDLDASEADSAEQTLELTANCENPEKILTKADIAQEDMKINRKLAEFDAENKGKQLNWGAEDDCDLMKVQKPRFLREVVEFLRKLDSREHIEAALQVAEQLIRRSPPDLRDVCTELAENFLQISTTVFLEDSNLNFLRLRSLVSLICAVPRQVLPFFMGQFYSKNQTIRGKLEILQCFTISAAELSNLSPEGQKSSGIKLIEEWKGPKQGKSISAGSSENKQKAEEIIKSRVEKTTRRWGGGERASESAGINQFAAVAHLFFFPLAQGFQLAYQSGPQDSENEESYSLTAFSRGKPMEIMSAEPLLLAKTIDTLGLFVVCAGKAMINRNLCRTLLEILFLTRFHPDSSVRQATLLSLSRILLNLTAVSFNSDYSGEIPELIAWLNDSIQGETDPEAKKFAQFCMHLIKELLGNPFDQLLYKAQKEAGTSSKSLLKIL